MITCFCFASRAQVKFKYHWRQISGPVTVVIEQPDSAETLVTGLNVEGFYDFEFSVTNDFGTGYDTCRVIVLKDVLAIDTTKPVTITRPEIKKFDVRMIERGSEVWFEIKSPRPQRVKINLYNSLGQVMATAQISVKTGNNYGRLPKPTAPGVYYIQFNTYLENVTKIFVL